MQIKNKLKNFLSEFWKGIIGLDVNQSIKTLSEKDLCEFYRYLGYQPLAMVLFFALLLWLTTTTVLAGAYDVLLAISFGCVLFFFLVKLCWPKWKIVVDSEDEEVDCEFNQVGFKGFLTYNGRDYLVEDYVLANNKLVELNLPLERDEEGQKEVRIFYSADDPKFLKITEVTHVDGLRLSYKIISWIFFSICFIATFVMVIGALVILI